MVLDKVEIQFFIIQFSNELRHYSRHLEDRK